MQQQLKFVAESNNISPIRSDTNTPNSEHIDDNVAHCDLNNVLNNCSINNSTENHTKNCDVNIFTNNFENIQSTDCYTTPSVSTNLNENILFDNTKTSKSILSNSADVSMPSVFPLNDDDNDDDEDHYQKKRLRIGDFMQQIVTQINSCNDKIWPNLLLDFTKNFAEHQVPYDLFVKNHHDLLIDILRIAIYTSKSSLVERRIFSCKLLLNIKDVLNQEMIENQVLPTLEFLIELETTTAVHFNLCFVLAHFAKRLGFKQFVSTIFPYFQQMYSIVCTSTNESMSRSMTIGFATLDSMITLLPYLFHFNNVLFNKHPGDISSITTEMPTDTEQFQQSMKELFSFISDQYLPLIKNLFESLIDFICQYRTSALPLEQEFLECFLQWKDQNKAHESITQTLYIHYQSLCFFVLVLRDHLSVWNSEHCDSITSDRWYLDFFYRLCNFLSSANETHELNPGIHFDLNQLSQACLMFNNSFNSNDLFEHSFESNDSTIPLVTSDNCTPTMETTNSSLQEDCVTSSSCSIDKVDMDVAVNSELTNQSFVGKFQLTKSRLLNKNINIPFYDATMHKLNFSSINNSYNLDIFGFFKYKSISLKMSLTNSIPILTDLYDVTKLTSSSIPTEENSEPILDRLINIFTLIIRDSNTDIILKMVNIFEKMIGKLSNPLRFYSFIVNVLQTQNIDVLGHLVANFFTIFSTMILNASSDENSSSAIENIINAFLQCEMFLSSKPKWRLYIQYLDVLLRLTQLISIDLVRKLIIPNLLNRFSTIRPIPCRQAVARCLLVIYIENFSQQDFERCMKEMIGEKLESSTESICIFKWFEENLRTSTKYQDRQIYIDIYAILLEFLLEKSYSIDTKNCNHYLADLTPLCPKLNNIDLNRKGNVSLIEKYSSLFLASIVFQYRLLHSFTLLAVQDRVNTVRASACTVLHSMLSFMQLFTSVYTKEEYVVQHKLISNYLNQFFSTELDVGAKLILDRMPSESDRITFSELKRLFILIDDARIGLCSDTCEQSEEVDMVDKFCSKDVDCSQVFPTEKLSDIEPLEISDDIIHLVEELLNTVELDSLELVEQVEISIVSPESIENDIEELDCNEFNDEVLENEGDTDVDIRSSPCRGIIIISGSEITKSSHETNANQGSCSTKKLKKIKYSKNSCKHQNVSPSSPSPSPPSTNNMNKSNKRFANSSMIPMMNVCSSTSTSSVHNVRSTFNNITTANNTAYSSNYCNTIKTNGNPKQWFNGVKVQSPITAFTTYKHQAESNHMNNARYDKSPPTNQNQSKLPIIYKTTPSINSNAYRHHYSPQIQPMMSNNGHPIPYYAAANQPIRSSPLISSTHNIPLLPSPPTPPTANLHYHATTQVVSSQPITNTYNNGFHTKTRGGNNNIQTRSNRTTRNSKNHNNHHSGHYNNKRKCNSKTSGTNGKKTLEMNNALENDRNANYCVPFGAPDTKSDVINANNSKN